MTRKYLLVPFAALVLAAAGCQESPTGNPVESNSNTQQTQPQQTVAPVATGDSAVQNYIVVMNDDVADNTLTKVAGDAFGFQKGGQERVFKNAIKGFAARMSQQQVAEMRRDPRVKYVEPDYHVQLSPTYTTTAVTSTQIASWGVQRVGGSRDGSGRVAWIVDTGIDLFNADLNVDTYRSRNFVYDGHANAQDGNGHGTHVGGIIGARNNTIGTIGVAANASLVAVRVLDDAGSGTYSAIIAGIDYVASKANVGDVMNMSLGGPASSALDDAVRRAAARGIRVVIAAGNSAVSATTTSPARVNAANVYTISAIDQNGYLASFSNYGNPPIDLAAPGVSILSTRLGGGTVYMSGTSMAAPHVAGLLLFGTIHYYGTALNDRDGYADLIAYR